MEMKNSIDKNIETCKKTPQLIDDQFKKFQCKIQQSFAILESLDFIGMDGPNSMFSGQFNELTATNAQSLGINLPKVDWKKDEVKKCMLLIPGCWNNIHLKDCMTFLYVIWQILCHEGPKDVLFAIEPNVFTFEWFEQIDYLEFLHLVLPRGMKFTQDEIDIITIFF